MSSKQLKHPCRDRIPCLLTIIYFHVQWTLSPIFRVFFIILLPTGCSSVAINTVEAPAIHSEQPHYSTIISSGKNFLDILTFDDDKLCRLDSYQRIPDFNSSTAYAESTGGDKIFFFCSTCRNIFDWRKINSFSALRNMRAYLENETKDAPTRTGKCRLAAGTDGAKVALKPLVSEVAITSLKCNFSGMPYKDKNIYNVKAYLTNVSGTALLTDDLHHNPERIINHGRLSPQDMHTFYDPAILYSEITDKLGSTALKTPACFLCYPNPGNRNNMGTPPTRLVIEGIVDGETFYWPIDINPPEEGKSGGIERNSRYSYSIEIKRKGTTDPDVPINLCDNEIKLDIEPWSEKTEYGIRF